MGRNDHFNEAIHMSRNHDPEYGYNTEDIQTEIPNRKQVSLPAWRMGAQASLKDRSN